MGTCACRATRRGSIRSLSPAPWLVLLGELLHHSIRMAEKPQGTTPSMMATACLVIEATKTSLSIIKQKCRAEKESPKNVEGDPQRRAAQGDAFPLRGLRYWGGERGPLVVPQGVKRENPRVCGEKGAPVLSQRLLKTQGSFSVSNKSRASHTNHLELPVGIQ